MATGPEHYREAEDWMTVADNAVGKSSEHVIMAAAMAQAHATLALAAATALASTGVGEADLGEWSALICEPDEGQDDAEDGDEHHFTRAQMDGEACTVCGADFAVGEPTVPSCYDFVEGQLFAHLACVEAYDEPMTNRDADPEHVAECDAYADAYADTPVEDGV